MQEHITKRTTDTLRSAFGLACGYSRNPLLLSGRDLLREKRLRFEATTKKMEVGRGGKVKGFLSFLSPFLSPYFFYSIYSIFLVFV